jgi:hypothetical protein
MEKTRASRMIGRIQQIQAELAYAQRRMFEIRTGVSTLTRDSTGLRSDGQQDTR